MGRVWRVGVALVLISGLLVPGLSAKVEALEPAPPEAVDRITFGGPADGGAGEHVVHLTSYIPTPSTNGTFRPGWVACTGTVIAPHWIVTAGHCVADLVNDTPVEILFGSTDLTQASSAVSDRVEIAPTYWARPQPTFNPAITSDIALVHTETPLGNGLELATSVHEPAWDDSHTGTVWGWGDTVAGLEFSYPGALHTATVELDDDSDCRDVAYGYIIGADVCTTVSGPSACTGDSGGPLVATDKRGQDVLTGIISIGDSDCEGYTIYTRVSAFRGWIDSVVGAGEHLSGDGYWLFDQGGGMRAFGGAYFYGGFRRSYHGSFTDVAPLPSGQGYWAVSVGGRIEGRGQLPWRPEEGLGYDLEPRWDWENPVVSGKKVWIRSSDEDYNAIAVTPTGEGVWLFTSLGRVISLGDARRFPANGQPGAPEDLTHLELNGPIIDGAATPTGLGYYLVGSDGGVFTFGDARFAGSMGGHPLNQPIISLVPDPDGNGYWLVASDGGVFAFNAPFRGSLGSLTLNKPIVGMVPHGNGYLMVGSDGGAFNFSDLPFYGSTGGKPPEHAVFAIASSTTN
ncbi:MAG: serine protease [Actinomycetia bacterium]|nr:serine protease [Actinomycetes bacterium]